MTELCQAEYYITKLNFPRLKKCTNKAKIKRNGICYCLLHDPERKKKISENNDKKSEEKKNQKHERS